MGYFILTNNPQVKADFKEVKFIDDSVEKVFTKTRDLIHQGYSLISHPLPASKKMLSSPFRSIVFNEKKDKKMDPVQVEVIENSLAKLNAHLALKGIDSANKADYQTIDQRLLETALDSMD